MNNHLEVTHKKNLEEELCLSCGLCCDGSIFTIVPLSHIEVKSPKSQVPLDYLSSKRSEILEQPCSHYVGNRCSIYNDPRKPHMCSQFKCRLLFEVKNKTASKTKCLSIIKEAKDQILEIKNILKNTGTYDHKVSLEMNVKVFQNRNLNTLTVLPILKHRLFKLFLQRHFGVFQSSHKEVRPWKDSVIELKLKFLRALISFVSKPALNFPF